MRREAGLLRSARNDELKESRTTNNLTLSDAALYRSLRRGRLRDRLLLAQVPRVADEHLCGG